MVKKVSVMRPPNADMRKYEVEDALRTMTRAEEIKRDSSLMRDVKKLATEKQQMLSKVVEKSASKVAATKVVTRTSKRS